MRIDEFSNISKVDGNFSAIEQRRFLLFGFDKLYTNVYREKISVISPILFKVFLNSPVTKIYNMNSPIDLTQ